MRHTCRQPVRCALLGLALGIGLAAAAGAQSRSAWQQHDGLEMTPANPLGIVQLACLPERNGDACEYDVSTIPPGDDVGWLPAPDPEVIDFSFYPSRVCDAPVICIDFDTPENLAYVDFTYFQTFVEIPADYTVTRFTIDFTGMDDGSRVSVFNSDYPDGVVVPGSYVYYRESGTADLSALVRSGEVNRVVVTQVDDCCPENQLQNATVVLNGHTLATVVVDAFMLPSQVKWSPNANDPAKGSFKSAGVFDTGSADVDLTGPASLEIGSRAFSIPGLTAKGASFGYEAEGIAFSVTPKKDGGSRGRYQLELTGDLSDAVALDGPIKLRFENDSVDAHGEVSLAAGRFKLGRTRGTLFAPVLYLAKAKATLESPGLDSLKLTAGFVTDGVTPAAPSDVQFAFGDAYAATIPAAAFRRSKERWLGELDAGAARLSIVLDYGRERITVKARGVELGEPVQGPGPLRIALSIGDEARGTEVRGVRAGRSLRY